MPANVDPFKRKPVAPSPTKEELLARATGATKKPILQTPPSATKTPGIVGNPPLPVGKIVGHISPADLTDVERATLAATGWTADIELPSTPEGLKELQKVVAEQQSVEVPLPVPVSTPPLKVDTVSINNLSPEKQQEIRDRIKNIAATSTAGAEQQAKKAEFARRESAVPGLGTASKVVEKSVEDFRAKFVGTQPPSTEMLAEMPLAPPPAPKTPEPTYTPQATETGAAGVTLTNCPHCLWDLADPDIPEPPYSDKLAFTQCFLGMRPFTKAYPILNGAAEVTFRTLTTREVDVVYKQAYKDKTDGKLPTDYDYWERLNRYRMFLQIQSFRASGPDGFFKDLPDGYSKETNPAGNGFWVQPEQAADIHADETALPVIETWMIEEVLKTEQLFRTVNTLCNGFNRLVSKMEAMVDNSDFWRPTGEQS